MWNEFPNLQDRRLVNLDTFDFKVSEKVWKKLTKFEEFLENFLVEIRRSGNWVEAFHAVKIVYMLFLWRLNRLPHNKSFSDKWAVRHQARQKFMESSSTWRVIARRDFLSFEFFQSMMQRRRFHGHRRNLSSRNASTSFIACLVSLVFLTVDKKSLWTTWQQELF